MDDVLGWARYFQRKYARHAVAMALPYTTAPDGYSKGEIQTSSP